MSKTMVRIEVAKFSELPEKIGRTVFVNDLEVALFRLSSGEVHAVENRCPHKDGVLSEGMVSGKYVFCPMHDWKIDVTDGKVQEPDHGCVKQFSTEVVEDNVYLILEDPK